MLTLGKVSIRVIPRLALTLLIILISTPFQVYEYFFYRNKVRNYKFKKPPIFIIGHWRSGTTHLHNLMWKDGRFGVVSTYQASMHPIALMGRGWLPRLFANQLPRTRPMDNVAIDLQGPQEEEMAMINATRALAMLQDPEALELLDRVGAEDPDLEVRSAARDAADLLRGEIEPS